MINAINLCMIGRMDPSIIKADIFFVIATVAVAFVSLGIVVALVYIIQILRDMKILSRKAKDEGEKIIDAVANIREEAEDKGGRITRRVYALLGLSSGKSRSSNKKDN